MVDGSPSLGDLFRFVGSLLGIEGCALFGRSFLGVYPVVIFLMAHVRLLGWLKIATFQPRPEPPRSSDLFILGGQRPRREIRKADFLERDGRRETIPTDVADLDSKDVGLTKDSPEIFRLAVVRAGLSVSPSSCLFVGEDVQERTTAMEAGLQVCPVPQQVTELLAEEDR